MTDLTYNVLLIHNKYRFAGGEDSVVANELELLKANGNNVFVFYKTNSDIDSLHPLEKILLPLRTIFSFSAASEVKKLIRKHKIQIVHVHNTLPLISFSVYYAAKHCGCSLVQTIHNFRFLCPNGIFYRDEHLCQDCTKSLICSVKHSCYRKSKLQSMLVALCLWFHRCIKTFLLPDAYIALTEFNKQKLATVIPPDKIFVKPNFTQDNADFSQPKTRDYFIFISRLDKNKGIYLLLEAFQSFPDETLVILGTGPEEEAIQHWIDSHHLTNIKLKGFTPHAEAIFSLYHAKALIFPTQCYEGFPVILAESFSVGTPVIGSNLGNTSSIVENGKTGLLFQYDSVEDCISKITDFINSPADAYQMEEECRSTFLQKYSPQKNYAQLLSIYTRISHSKNQNRH